MTIGAAPGGLVDGDKFEQEVCDTDPLAIVCDEGAGGLAGVLQDLRDLLGVPPCDFFPETLAGELWLRPVGSLETSLP